MSSTLMGPLTSTQGVIPPCPRIAARGRRVQWPLPGANRRDKVRRFPVLHSPPGAWQSSCASRLMPDTTRLQRKRSGFTSSTRARCATTPGWSAWIRVTCRVDSSDTPRRPSRSSASPTLERASVAGMVRAGSRDEPRMAIASTRPSNSGGLLRSRMVFKPLRSSERFELAAAFRPTT